jgi:uncharacterized protein
MENVMKNVADPAAGKHVNRLAAENSPYLLQHARNPVDWFPWGDEALAKAKEEDKAIFLSIGYSACHWCHVMAHESFEDEEIAAFLNEHFVSIKVDREERPDLDAIYMSAVAAMTGSGGWPMTVFLTPHLEPFYGGTYFPPRDHYGRPGFLTLLKGVARAWREQRDEILENANGLTEHLGAVLTASAESPTPLHPDLISGAARQLGQAFDETHGGWSAAPKFPSPAAIGLLLREYTRTGEKHLLHMAVFTLDKMAMGGLFDHLGGGFHRYSVEEKWLVPHFEKMLYDNAQLAEACTMAWQLTGEARHRRTAEQTLDYVLRVMRDPAGGFYSSEDADSEGGEGMFYLWKRAEIIGILGEEDGALFTEFYNVREDGNFPSHEPYHKNRNILHATMTEAAFAAEKELEPEAYSTKLADMRARLLAVREKRSRPGLDDKVLTAWNALMIRAFARAAQAFGEERYRDAAVNAAAFLRSELCPEGVLLRTWRAGNAGLPGYLDDYAFAVNAFIDLYETTFAWHWLEAALELAERMIRRFHDEDRGGFFATTEDHGPLIVRTRPMQDSAEPSGNSMAALGLLRLHAFFGDTLFEEKARKALENAAAMMERVPQGFLTMLRALDFLVHPVTEIVFSGAADSAALPEMLRAAHTRFLPNRILALAGEEAEEKHLAARIPLFKSRVSTEKETVVHVCRDGACRQPARSAQELAAELGRIRNP